MSFGACPASVTVVADQIKLSSFIMMNEVEAKGYTHPIWLWFLGPARLDLRVSLNIFPTHAVSIAII